MSLGQWTDKNKKLAKKIKSCRVESDVGIDELLKKVRIQRSTYYNHLRDPEKITLGELRTYINTLNIPVETILDALYLKRNGG